MNQPVAQVFISYAHTDNEKPQDVRQGWVDRFYETLSIELRQLGLDINFWRDARDMSPNDFFDERIFSAVEGSAVFVAVVSPTYPKRPYCLRELNHFVSRPGIEPQEAAQRIVKVLKSPLDPGDQDKDLPLALQRREGFKFYRFDRQSNRVVRFWRSDGTPTHDEYWDRMYEIAVEIARHIRSKHAPASPAHDKDTALTIYLAEPSADNWSVHRTVRAELERELNARVLPECELPRTEIEAVQVIDEALAKSCVSIHLLGETAGYVPDGTSNIPITQLQMGRAARQAQDRGSFHRLIWASPDLQVKGDQQADFLRRLESGEALLPTDELVRESVEHFKNAAIDLIRKSSVAFEERRTSSNLSTLFLIYRQEDEATAQVYRDLLLEQGIEVLRPEFDGSEKECRAAFEFAASVTDAAIVCCDTAQEYWVLQVLRQLDDWSALGRAAPIRSKLVLLAGSPSSRKASFRSQLADHVIDATNCTADEAIVQVVKSAITV